LAPDQVDYHYHSPWKKYEKIAIISTTNPIAKKTRAKNPATTQSSARIISVNANENMLTP